MKIAKILREMKYENLINNKEFTFWFNSFQNHKTTWVPPEFYKLKEQYDLVDKNKNYIAYRGIFIKSPKKEHLNWKLGMLLPDEGLSWSCNKDTAIQFARDDHYMGTLNRGWKPGKSLGFIIEYQFNYNDVLFDLEYMNNHGYSDIRYPKEKEIIVRKELRNCKIVNLIKDQMRDGRKIRTLIL